MPPTKAIVLAAGFGTRMLPLTRQIPKPLLPLYDVPMLQHTLQTLRDWGVRDVLINCHHRAEAILEFTQSNPVDGLRLNLSYEPDILGTGGVLRKAEWFLDEHPLWMINADVAMALDPAPLLDAAPRGKTLATLWMHPERGPRTVEVKRNLVTSFRSPTPGGPHTYTFCGLHLLSPRILRYIPEGFSSIISAYEKAMADGFQIRGVTGTDAWWADIGTPDQYLQAHREIAERRTANRPGGDLKRKRSRAYRPTHSVVLPGATVGPNAVLNHAIIAPGVYLDDRATGILLQAPFALDPIEVRAVQKVVGTIDHAVAQCFTRSGSARSYTRIRGHDQTVMLVRDAGTREENALYAGHARFLHRCGIRVPRVLADHPQDRMALFEDVGDNSLTSIVKNNQPSQNEEIYRALLETVERLHTTATKRARRSHLHLMPPFSPKLYRWEHDLFINQFLSHEPNTTDADIRGVRKELSRIARLLHAAPQVLIHRDLQSSNVHRHQDELVLIDFQGMRFGPAVYDLASLLCDPYVTLAHSTQRRLLAHYDPELGEDPTLFWMAAVQRLCQALGAFGRLARLPGGEPFRDHVVPGLRMLRRALNRLDPPCCTLGMAVHRALQRRQHG